MIEKRAFFLLNAACAMLILHLISRVHLATFVTPEVNGCAYYMRQPI
jgi:hypothetical protein